MKKVEDVLNSGLFHKRELFEIAFPSGYKTDILNEDTIIDFNHIEIKFIEPHNSVIRIRANEDYYEI